jgi:hypothetical protein
MRKNTVLCIEYGLFRLDARKLHKQNQIFARDKTEGKLAANSATYISINLQGKKNLCLICYEKRGSPGNFLSLA